MRRQQRSNERRPSPRNSSSGLRALELDATVDAILAAARTGEVGDGKIFVLPVERVVRIRTGETDVEAVTPVTAMPAGWSG